MLRLAVPVLLVLGMQAAWTQRRAEAHIPPPAYMRLTITDEHAEIMVAVAFDVFRVWFAIDAKVLAGDGTLTPPQREAVEAMFARCLRVQIDGLEVPAVLQGAEIESIEDHMRTWTYVNLRVRCATVVPAQQVAFVWQGYSTDTEFVFSDIDAELEAYGELSFPKFREQEPEYVWHRPVIVGRPPPVVLPRTLAPRHVAVPLLSIGLVLALLVSALALRRRLRGWQVAAVLLVGGLTAIQLRDVASLDVALPGEDRLMRPAEAEALAVFASLHRGVYAAVEREDEDEVYDLLAENVTGELLPTLYLEIRRSMILQEEGGVVAKIQKTEIVETTLLDEHEEQAPWFKVRARWRVEGRVGHWGHTHQRINEYLANATVVARDGRWKIAAIDVLEETRVDDGGEGR